MIRELDPAALLRAALVAGSLHLGHVAGSKPVDMVFMENGVRWGADPGETLAKGVASKEFIKRTDAVQLGERRFWGTKGWASRHALQRGSLCGSNPGPGCCIEG